MSARGPNTHPELEITFVPDLGFHDVRWPCARASIMNGLPKNELTSVFQSNIDTWYISSRKKPHPTVEVSSPGLAKRGDPGGTAFFRRSLAGTTFHFQTDFKLEFFRMLLDTWDMPMLRAVAHNPGAITRLRAAAPSERRSSKVNLNSLANCLTEIQRAHGASCVRTGPCTARRTQVQEDPAPDVQARSPPTDALHSLLVFPNGCNRQQRDGELLSACCVLVSAAVVNSPTSPAPLKQASETGLASLSGA